MRRTPDIKSLREVPFRELDGVCDGSDSVQDASHQPGEDLELINIPLVGIVREMEATREDRVSSDKEGNS